ncbi:BON domain-containing protein [Azospirillum picis]|uniref:Osmotically-inducible protein OsmY n=1 Tax=Azospirillum picis TaxID=488438 RepID=A0ABU0MHG7_9PROT|nr:BON domain-containing protein [Azospirillum picis]MBP2298866.1 osmotically-inducible protein OsmY [Azospirillum picis]MDQ0532892.1 osmotically-inducible protein OsmY [Azospirillum picis]
MTGLSRLWTLLGLACAAGLPLAGCAPLVLGTAGGAAVVATQERGFGGFVSDTEIRARINHLWVQHSLDMTNRIGLTVDQGRVLLTGRAADPQMRLDAVRLTWQAPGVKEVINEIQIDNGSSLLDSATDTWISTQLRSRITFDANIHSQNYSIDTVDGVVYLMGVAASQAELDRVVQHARSVPKVQRVVSYVQLLSNLQG